MSAAGKSLDDAIVAIVVTGQLLPFEDAAPPEQTQSELDAAKMRLAADPILGPGFGNPLNAEVRDTSRSSPVCFHELLPIPHRWQLQRTRH